jgi:PAT family beta-lactamase induction signal transducer AmpG
MQPADIAVAECEIPSRSHERPWLFTFLIGPPAVFALGLSGGALSFLLRREGVDPGRSASIVALLSLPHAIYFLWSPVTDFFVRRRTWLLLSAAVGAGTLLAAFNQPRLGSTKSIVLLFLAACFVDIVVAACGGMLGELTSEVNRRRAGSFYQSGSLAFGAITVFLLTLLAGRLPLHSLGLVVAAMMVIPALFALAVPRQSVVSDRTPRQTAALCWSEFKETFLRWKAIPYTLLITAPFCSGAMIGLLTGLARDYGVSAQQVAWINGLGGAFLTTAGALTVTLIPTRIRAPIAFLLAGIANAAALSILALGPLRPAVYFAGTVLNLFTIGAGYALFTGVVLEFLGGSGKSGSSRYAIINSLGNLPVAYMSYLDGRAYAHWGPRGMSAADALLSACGATLLLAHFIFSRRRKQQS